MSRSEAADLLQKTEGRICVRYWTRPDGGAMTKDCLKSQKRRTKWIRGVVTVLSLVGLGSLAAAIQHSAACGEEFYRATTGDISVPMMGKLVTPKPSGLRMGRLMGVKLRVQPSTPSTPGDVRKQKVTHKKGPSSPHR